MARSSVTNPPLLAVLLRRLGEPFVTSVLLGVRLPGISDVEREDFAEACLDAKCAMVCDWICAKRLDGGDALGLLCLARAARA